MRTAHILLLSALFTYTSCGTSTEQPADPGETEIPSLSIYHLEEPWVSQNGDTLQFSDLHGNVLVTVMIYTSCQAACPRLVADMRNIHNQVGVTESPVRYLLISIDPEADTPERLKVFAQENMMDTEEWLFLQGTPEAVRQFANVMAVKYDRISPIDFSHSNIISVFDTQGVMQFQQEGLSVDSREVVARIRELVGQK